MKDCPVCGRVGLADDVQECPQCNADLECFELLESLHEGVDRAESTESGLASKKALEELRTTLSKDLGNQRTSARMRGYGISALLILVFVVLILFIYHNLMLEERFNNMIFQLEPQTGAVDEALKTPELSELNVKMETITQRLAAIENGLTAISAAKEALGVERFSAALEDLSKISERLVSLENKTYDSARGRTAYHDENNKPAGRARDEVFLYHEPRTGETLWSIASQYYDSGRFYPVLLEYNPGLGIYFDRSYGKIRILKDRQRAEQVLDEVMTVQGSVTLVHYNVIKKDTWERISERFYGNAAHAAKLKALNPRVGLAPGDRVVVPLQ